MRHLIRAAGVIALIWATVGVLNQDYVPLAVLVLVVIGGCVTADALGLHPTRGRNVAHRPGRAVKTTKR